MRVTYNDILVHDAQLTNSKHSAILANAYTRALGNATVGILFASVYLVDAN
jgi:hypothetical protein